MGVRTPRCWWVEISARRSIYVYIYTYVDITHRVSDSLLLVFKLRSLDGFWLRRGFKVCGGGAWKRILSMLAISSHLHLHRSDFVGLPAAPACSKEVSKKLLDVSNTL